MKKTSDVIWQDAQHQMLFQLLDEVGHAGRAEAVMHRLKFYAESHFGLEETYMEMLDYPKREEHVLAHNRFRDELELMIKTPENREKATRQIISLFLTEWLKRHIFGIDKELEAFLLEKGVK